MTPDKFIPFWDALTERDRKLISENLQTGTKPGSGFFSSMRSMQGGLIFLLKGHIRIFLSSNEGREITLVTMNPSDIFLVHPGDATHFRKGQLRYETSEDCEYAFLPKSIMTTVMAHCPEAMEFVLNVEELLLRMLADSVSYAAFVTVRGNLARTLLEKSALKGTVRLTH